MQSLLSQDPRAQGDSFRWGESQTGKYLSRLSVHCRFRSLSRPERWNEPQLTDKTPDTQCQWLI